MHALCGGGTEQIQTGFTQAKALFLQDRRVVMALRTPFLPSLNLLTSSPKLYRILGNKGYPLRPGSQCII